MSLLALNIALPAGDDTSLASYLRESDGNPATSLVYIEFSTRKADRLSIASPQPRQTSDPSPEIATLEPPSPVPLDADIDADQSPDVEAIDPPSATDTAPRPALSLDELCTALLTSAEQNNLPVPFFANLIWQESRLRDDAVSRVGALGIAQFMPKVAMETGLDNPFDPRQAIPASARLLRALREHFGNLGFVAAAYNAGAHRVSEWLEHRRALPRETRDYVVRVTGRSAEDWRKMPPDDAALTFVRRLPCRGLPAFADLEHAQMQEAQTEKAEAPPRKTVSQQVVQSHPATPSAHSGHRHFADRARQHSDRPHEAIRAAARNRSKPEAEHPSHAAHLKSRRTRRKKPTEIG